MSKVYTYEESLRTSEEYFGNELPAKVFLDKYALRNNDNEILENHPKSMWSRIAKEIVRIEDNKFHQPLSYDEVYSSLEGFKRIIPQGSILYGCGNKYQTVSLSNCFVIDNPVDSYSGITYTDQQIANISKRRGGVGWDISTLRPKNSKVNNAAKTSSGSISFLHRFSHTLREVAQFGRRGAGLCSISIHHPDILDFITIKNNTTNVTGCNISIRLTDEFLNALEDNKEYQLRWPVDNKAPEISTMVSAKEIWDIIIKSARDYSEPGLLFWDNIIRESPADCYPNMKTLSTNPCGELPLDKWNACRLLALNLFYYVKNPFTKDSIFDYNKLYEDAQLAQRIMDDIVDLEIECVDSIIQKINNDPEPEYIKIAELTLWENIKDKAVKTRRTGTGITALGDVLAALNIPYGSKKSVKISEQIYEVLKLGTYRSSVDMAKELGPFPEWQHEVEKNNPFLLRIKDTDTSTYCDKKIDGNKIWKDMKQYGRRNVNLLTTAPTGSISILAQLQTKFHGTTSGIEPLFMKSYTRRKKGNPNDKDFRTDFTDQSGDSWMHFDIKHAGIDIWSTINNNNDVDKSPYVIANDINWLNRIKLQGAANIHIDNSISSTINLPQDISQEEVAKIYWEAWKAGLKGVTIYREGSRTGVLVEKNKGIVKTTASKRPKKLKCDVHHISVMGTPYFVLVGIFEGDPYEIFAGTNGVIDKKVKQGIIIRKRRYQYKAVFDDDSELSPIKAFCKPDEEVITRLISASLRHGTDISFLVHQLEKTDGDLQGFSKSISRALKKYIKDGTKVYGEECPTCSSKLLREEGCLICKSCGWGKC